MVAVGEESVLPIYWSVEVLDWLLDTRHNQICLRESCNLSLLLFLFGFLDGVEHILADRVVVHLTEVVSEGRTDIRTSDESTNRQQELIHFVYYFILQLFGITFDSWSFCLARIFQSDLLISFMSNERTNIQPQTNK